MRMQVNISIDLQSPRGNYRNPESNKKNMKSGYGQIYSVHQTIGNQSMINMLDNKNNGLSSEKIIQRQAQDSGQTQSGGCECDCEGYDVQVARHYINQHIKYQEYHDRWENTPKEIKLKLLRSECHYQDRHPPPCSWVSVLDYEDENATGQDKKNYKIYVMLMGSQRFNVVSYDSKYPLCSYSFVCDSSAGFTKIYLTEVVCIPQRKLLPSPYK